MSDRERPPQEPTPPEEALLQDLAALAKDGLVDAYDSADGTTRVRLTAKGYDVRAAGEGPEIR